MKLPELHTPCGRERLDTQVRGLGPSPALHESIQTVSKPSWGNPSSRGRSLTLRDGCCQQWQLAWGWEPFWRAVQEGRSHICACGCMCASLWHSVSVEVRGQLVDSVLSSLCVSSRDQTHQGWWHVPLFIESSHWPVFCFFRQGFTEYPGWP